MTTIRKSLIVAAIAFSAVIMGGCASGIAGQAASPGVPEVTMSQPTSADTALSNHLTAVVGQPITYWLPGDQGFKAVATVNSATWQSGKLTTYGEFPGSGGYLIVDVTVKGISGQTHVSSSDWTVQDAKSYSYDEAFMSGVSQELGYADLGPGQQLRGKVAFDVTQGSVTSIQMEVFLQGTLTWTVE